MVTTFLSKESEYRDKHPNQYLFDPTVTIEGLELKKMCPTYFQYEIS